MISTPQIRRVENREEENVGQDIKLEKRMSEQDAEAQEQTRGVREERTALGIRLREALERERMEGMHQNLQQQESAKLLVQDAFALHSDSGYASNDVVRTQPEVKIQEDRPTVDVSGDPFPKGSDFDGSNNESQLRSGADYEIASVISDADDNRSIGITPKSRAVLEAQSQIRALFALNEGLQSPAKELLARMGRERFIENLRRLLMAYYKSQKQLALSNLEHAVVKLLSSRTLREGFAIYVADQLVPTSERMRLDHEKDMARILDKRASVEAWLANNLAFASHSGSSEDGDDEDANAQHDDSGDSEDENQTEVTQAEYAHISRAAQFLCAGDAFENLLLDIQVLLIPSEFRILAQTLLTIRKDDVRIDSEYRPAFGNKCKILVNEATSVDWNWWPLSPVIPPLPVDRVRIWWKCHCGDDLWEDIPQNHTHVFENLLSLRKSTIRRNHLCQTAFRRSNQAVKTHSPISNGSSTAANPPASALVADTQVQAGLNVSSSPSGSTASDSLSRSVSCASSTDATSLGSTTIAIPTSQQRLVLFGVDGMRSTLDLKHVDVINVTKTDAEFFRKLNSMYRSARGFLKLWFSIWRLNHCDFVKGGSNIEDLVLQKSKFANASSDRQFRKFMRNRVTEVCKALPEGKDLQEYTYSPLPPEGPGITEHMWKHALFPCDGRIMGLKLVHSALGWLGWFHECIEIDDTSTDLIDRIPEKHSKWQVDTKGIEDAFGIMAREDISILYVVIYHVFMLAGPFAFWAWRESQKGVSWDLQDASVPSATVLGLLSLFWASARPLGLFESHRTSRSSDEEVYRRHPVMLDERMSTMVST
ncbi:hypothetical protein LTR10_013268 [Elasticomyces elasticus]|uniref:Uncharacterized protein n=1 Tax=Exophiala sideris TaxID=1016849 RepID=A0ABR0J6U9_9EURO|nr:hypothetical protein LTR10_013268 [Elasticomyces elasticus]KAK5027504.1 hypothetical protein LTS07_007106 [Exophiala sideris]KAK5034792.1 hypothetical protein LTR13_005974 [Exophiala sideris]KAK5056471.1 hypothetical protein LTR69_008012 [Exophiala sideris]KAK5181038.1 hypothetical protein LTR44_006369 [Eurotiomycetes sp. CCFEE 6388]